jgi:hypothetical protein
MVDDYLHRWTYIRNACEGIYLFGSFFLYHTPKALLYYLPKYIITESAKSLGRIYRATPPLKEWPKILYRAIVVIGKAFRDFIVGIFDLVKATPKALYTFGKYLGKQFVRGIKAVPGLVKRAVKSIVQWAKRAGQWLANLFLRYIIKDYLIVVLYPLCIL